MPRACDLPAGQRPTCLGHFRGLPVQCRPARDSRLVANVGWASSERDRHGRRKDLAHIGHRECKLRTSNCMRGDAVGRWSRRAHGELCRPGRLVGRRFNDPRADKRRAELLRAELHGAELHGAELRPLRHARAWQCVGIRPAGDNLAANAKRRRRNGNDAARRAQRGRSRRERREPGIQPTITRLVRRRHAAIAVGR